MKDDWWIWIGMMLIGLNFMLFGFAYLQNSNMWWYYQYVLVGAMFCSGLSLVLFCIKSLVDALKLKVGRSE